MGGIYYRTANHLVLWNGFQCCRWYSYLSGSVLIPCSKCSAYKVFIHCLWTYCAIKQMVSLEAQIVTIYRQEPLWKLKMKKVGKPETSPTGPQRPRSTTLEGQEEQLHTGHKTTPGKTEASPSGLQRPRSAPTGQHSAICGLPPKPVVSLVLRSPNGHLAPPSIVEHFHFGLT